MGEIPVLKELGRSSLEDHKLFDIWHWATPKESLPETELPSLTPAYEPSVSLTPPAPISFSLS